MKDKKDDKLTEKKVLKDVKTLKKKILDKYKDKIKCIVMMGSVVRGEFKSKSDVDIFVVLDDTEKPISLNEKIKIDKEKAKSRTQVERNYSIVKNYHRLDKTISWDNDRFTIQACFAFMAWNAKCWLKAIFKEPYYILMAKCA